MRNGLLVFMVNTAGDPETERSAVVAFNQQQVDGFVYACLYHRVVDLPPGLGSNVVVLDGRTRRPRFPAVGNMDQAYEPCVGPKVAADRSRFPHRPQKSASRPVRAGALASAPN